MQSSVYLIFSLKVYGLFKRRDKIAALSLLYCSVYVMPAQADRLIAHPKNAFVYGGTPTPKVLAGYARIKGLTRVNPPSANHEGLAQRIERADITMPGLGDHPAVNRHGAVVVGQHQQHLQHAGIVETELGIAAFIADLLHLQHYFGCIWMWTCSIKPLCRRWIPPVAPVSIASGWKISWRGCCKIHCAAA